ncbi:hypothetical protein EIP91_000523 [Steccherinum ochraceum]|uniref:Uncharacterized protein n=1 Tax=Steccherinum ochraceum TaxID=92696 RepID=A0A4R0S349_9APHY|nr:hypothetical protein EIP91_000523 [Steccherinum ochraceum]
MRFTAVLAGLLAVTASSAMAAPHRRLEARVYDESAIMARDRELAVRDVMQAIHTREFGRRDAVGTANILNKRKMAVPPRPDTPPPAADIPEEAPARGGLRRTNRFTNLAEAGRGGDGGEQQADHTSVAEGRPETPPAGGERPRTPIAGGGTSEQPSTGGATPGTPPAGGHAAPATQ